MHGPERHNFEVEGASHVLRRGSLTITKPWQLHSLGAPQLQPNQLIYFILDVGVRRPNSTWAWPNWILASESEKRRLGRAITFVRQNLLVADPRTTQLFEELFDTVKNNSTDAGMTKTSILINAALLSLLTILEGCSPVESGESTTEETVRHFLSELKSHLSHPWRLDEMADQCGISRSQFALLCKEITNQSPLNYLNNLRLEHAANRLVSQPKIPVTEVCFDSGFNSSQYFSRRFSERFGASPREYRSMV